MSMSGSPIVDAFGNVIEACVIIRDVTDEVNARLRLFEQQHLLESSQAAGRIGSWAVDRLTGRMDWSAEHTGCSSAIRPSARPRSSSCSSWSTRTTARRSAARSTRRRFHFEARFIADPEDVRICASAASTCRGWRGARSPAGNHAGRNRGARRAGRPAARRGTAAARLRRGVDRDGDPRHGRSPAAGQHRAVRDLRTDPRRAAKRHFQDLTHPEDLGDDVPMMEAAASGAQKNHVREKRYIHADGHTIWTEVASH